LHAHETLGINRMSERSRTQDRLSTRMSAYRFVSTGNEDPRIALRLGAPERLCKDIHSVLRLISSH
jgi:hypothetical protein